MKTKIIFITLFISTVISAQTKKEIAGVYFKKAEKSMEKIDYVNARVSFDKGVAVLDTINTTAIAQQGAFIYYEIKNYDRSKQFAKYFFKLSRNKTSDDYTQMLEMYVDMEEKILEKRQAEQKKIEAEKAKQRVLKKIDSLKKVWKKLETSFVLKVDSLYAFNRKGIALYKSDDFYGVIDHRGNIIVEADTYTDAKQNEGYFLLMNKKNNPDKIYSYNSETNKSIMISNPSNYDDDLEGYGVVTKPRGNGRVVMYPDLGKTIVYDLEQEKFVEIGKFEDFLKDLKKNKKIDKYDAKDRTVKIDKKWYLFGNNLGGQVFSLYSVESQKLDSYLFSDSEEDEAKIVDRKTIGFVGAYYSNKLEALDENSNSLWITKQGEQGSKPILNNTYRGKTKIIKRVGGYHFVKDGNVFLRNETLETLPDFLRKNK